MKLLGARPLINTLLSSVRELLKHDGHSIQCQFKGCTCGAVEDYKVARAQMLRLLRKLEEEKISQKTTIPSIDPAVRAAEAIVRRGLIWDTETMAIIIRNAYIQRTEEIKQEISKHCKEALNSVPIVVGAPDKPCSICPGGIALPHCKHGSGW